ncbi:Elongator complex protein 4 [Kockiozyma suomiensis]|uniref:Elongator complex protein 4 n=1 Tax=Kockiozyma suomiensis TaxID=1337062 RepID=UPI003343B182
MSFRKRNDPISLSARHPPPIISSSAPLRLPPETAASKTTAVSSPSSSSSTPLPPSLRPSPLFSDHVMLSTGTSSLDKLLLHGGQPLGTNLLIEESSATDFASVLARCYAAQGVCNGDLVAVVGVEEGRWGAELPSKMGPRRSSKSSSSKSVEGGPPTPNQQGLKIAWRYRGTGANAAQNADTETHSSASDENYCTPFNITARALHQPTNLRYISVEVGQGGNVYDGILSRVSALLASIKREEHKILRLVIPGFLNPTVYADVEFAFQPSRLLGFLTSLRSIMRSNEGKITTFITLSTGLFDLNGDGFNNVLIPWIEMLVDGVIRLVPTPSLSKSQNKDDEKGSFQGFVDVIKVPIVSDRGAMVVRNTEYAFKIGKGGMRIEKWGIPVMIDEAEEKKKASDPLDF